MTSPVTDSFIMFSPLHSKPQIPEQVAFHSKTKIRPRRSRTPNPIPSRSQPLPFRPIVIAERGIGGDNCFCAPRREHVKEVLLIAKGQSPEVAHRSIIHFSCDLYAKYSLDSHIQQSRRTDPCHSVSGSETQPFQLLGGFKVLVGLTTTRGGRRLPPGKAQQSKHECHCN